MGDFLVIPCLNCIKITQKQAWRSLIYFAWMESMYFREYVCRFSRKLHYFCILGVSHLNRHRENFWAFTGPKIDFGLILLILNMVIHRSFTGPTHFISANVRGLVSFAVTELNSGCPTKKEDSQGNNDMGGSHLARIQSPQCSSIK